MFLQSCLLTFSCVCGFCFRQTNLSHQIRVGRGGKFVMRSIKLGSIGKRCLTIVCTLKDGVCLRQEDFPSAVCKKHWHRLQDNMFCFPQASVPSIPCFEPSPNTLSALNFLSVKINVGDVKRCWKRTQFNEKMFENENSVFGVFAQSQRKTKQWKSTKEFFFSRPKRGNNKETWF